MAIHIIENEFIRVEIESFGAEIKSLYGKKTEREYMWYGDEKFWGRTSPILFPFVGSVKEKKYKYKDKEYEMGQHGFARDMEFETVSKSEEEVCFCLRATEETKKKYPFDFCLQVAYHLEKNKVKVGWKVINEGNEVMYFSIGGHPAFQCPILEGTKQSDYYIAFDTEKVLQSDVIEDGLIGNALREYKTEGGLLKITDDMFDGDALVIEKNQANEVSLCLPDKMPYLTVAFSAPLFGIWSPTKKNAPFICIEPWFGRADRADFTGELQDREWGNCLEPTKSFETFYTIEAK